MVALPFQLTFTFCHTQIIDRSLLSLCYPLFVARLSQLQSVRTQIDHQDGCAAQAKLPEGPCAQRLRRSASPSRPGSNTWLCLTQASSCGGIVNGLGRSIGVCLSPIHFYKRGSHRQPTQSRAELLNIADQFSVEHGHPLRSGVCQQDG